MAEIWPFEIWPHIYRNHETPPHLPPGSKSYIRPCLLHLYCNSVVCSVIRNTWLLVLSLVMNSHLSRSLIVSTLILDYCSFIRSLDYIVLLYCVGLLVSSFDLSWITVISYCFVSSSVFVVRRWSHLRVYVNCRNRWVLTSVSVVELSLRQRQSLDLVTAFWLWRSTSSVS